MGTGEIVSLILFFVCVLLMAFFSSSEVAFVSLQRLRVKHLANTGEAGAQQVARIAEKPERFLATVLLGNNFIGALAAALATVVAISFLSESMAVVVSTVGTTVLILVFGDIVPKFVATRLGERMALIYATPVSVLIWVLSPIAGVFMWIGDKITRLLGVEPSKRLLVSEEEIRTAITTGIEEGALEESKGEMVDRAIRFGDRRVSEVMTPRPEIVWVEKGTRIADFLQIYAQSTYSRFPVFEGSVENVVGILWIKDVLLAEAKGKITGSSSIDELVRPAYFVPESKSVADLFGEMQRSNSHMSLMVDEFGGVSGLVTLEQLLEEIVGELGDELARTQKIYETIDENTFQIGGSMRIDEANEQLQLGLPEGEYETVAGFVLELLGHIPKEGDQLKHNNLKLVVTEMKGFKVEKVLVTKEKDATPAPDV